MKILLLVLCLQGQMTLQAKNAFDNIQLVNYSEIAKNAFAKFDCNCQNCDCIDCKCGPKGCICKECTSFDAIYAKCVKDNQIIVLAVAAPTIENVPWKIVSLPSLSGEKPGYIVGVPKDGKLIRLDFPPNTPRQRIRLDVLHVYYPLIEGYQECPTCPQGRVYVGVTKR